MGQSSFDSLRKQLDDLNLQLLQLINRRAEIVQEIGEIKKKHGMQKFDPIRERDMLANLIKSNKGPFSDRTIKPSI